jgi:hypothetical protein
MEEMVALVMIGSCDGCSCDDWLLVMIGFFDMMEGVDGSLVIGW